MGPVEELLYKDEGKKSCAASRAKLLAFEAQKAADRAALELKWEFQHPREWDEWVRIKPLLGFTYHFRRGFWDFPDFLSHVGPRPSSEYVIQRRNETLPYQEGNLVWVKPPPRVESPYLTVEDAAAYSRCETKTLYNHHSLGKVRSVKTRPLLFLCEDLDAWLSTRPKRKKKQST